MNRTLRDSLIAKRIPPRHLPQPTTLAQKQGLRYEKRVVKALVATGLDIEHGPWFEYWGGVCCPDVVIYQLAQNRAIVVEVKLTYTPLAIKKLNTIYCPVVAQATGLKIYPLVISKNLLNTNDQFFVAGDINSALLFAPPILHYRSGPILLGAHYAK